MCTKIAKRVLVYPRTCLQSTRGVTFVPTSLTVEA